ncbi:MAG: rhodanese-like domain-containing protein [Firmicutes bacterium]|nr:rhodanese-like domain-containing protein [Bacillota bacterium]
MKIQYILIIIAVIIVVAAIVHFSKNNNGDFETITMEAAQEAFAEDGDYVIVDVRRADEYAGGHIPGAINIANESITDKGPAELADKDQLIYVYCRSGRRSRDAASKLTAMGYTNIVDCGGIMDWTGDVVF